MIKTTEMMLEELKEYSNPAAKLSRMAKQGECFPIVRGLYETDRTVPGYLLAGSIYGPSYISFEYALAHYGLIPETVYTITCATFEKKKKKRYETMFGTFIYRDVPSEASGSCRKRSIFTVLQNPKRPCAINCIQCIRRQTAENFLRF